VEPLYAILGCGSVGFAVATELKKQGKKVIIVDIDEDKVESLRDQNLDAIVGDISDPNVLSKIGEFEAALILGSDGRINKKTVETIKALYPEANIVARAANPMEKEELESAGVDMALLLSNVITSAAIRYLERAESVRRSKKLLKAVQYAEGKRLGIVTHDNPDPDAIASALALKSIAETVGIESEILYHGDVGHQANKAFVNLLNVEMKRIDPSALERFDKFAIVDASSLGPTNPIAKDVKIDIIIDHHPIGKNVDAEYSDIRPNMGATSTIMTKYLQELDIEIDKELATALLYGIRTDTQEFKKNTYPADLTAAAFLYPLTDRESLDRLETPQFSVETLDALAEAIKNKRIQSSYLVSNVGFIVDRDVIPQAADYLLNLEGISTVIVFGLNETLIHISGRSTDIRLNIGNVLSEAFNDIGSGGGHANAAAAQIPLGLFSGVRDKQTLLRLSEEAVIRRFLHAAGMEEKE
jgi:nanoRNase/pAp phosphatase (c-di-AMP/oligoRNAs hydrolase)/precorrin-6B methylase 2